MNKSPQTLTSINYPADAIVPRKVFEEQGDRIERLAENTLRVIYVLNRINEDLRDMYERSPGVFPKQLEQMGASDVLKWTITYLKLFNIDIHNIVESLENEFNNGS